MNNFKNNSFEPPFLHPKRCLYDVTRPIPSLLLLVAPVTSLLPGLEGEYALCPLRLAFHTPEVRLLTCVAASHAGRNTQIRTDFINTVPIRVKECD